MNLSEISLAFKGCIGEAPLSFKDYLIRLNLLKDDLENGTVISNANDFILRDIEILLDKALINLSATDLLIKRGYFNWGFVTSYYSNFYSVMALNRLKLNFATYTSTGIECELNDYFKKELRIKLSNKSGGSHQAQFQKFYDNYLNFKNTKSIDRFWTLGIQQFKLRPEALLRDEVNYSIEEYYYYELKLDINDFNKICRDNTNDPAKKREEITKPVNYSLPNLELALSRIRIIIYILNYIANTNLEYKSYFVRRCNQRITNIKLKYPKISSWLLSYLEEWLQFIEIETDDMLEVN